MKLIRIFRHVCLVLFVGALHIKTAKAYSVLTHEALIDASWQKSIIPLLKLKFPGITPEQLKEAHSYVYGGCLIADMGYFPFGSTYYTNLAHYVRTGDFVSNLVNEAQNLNEYAFALGSVCHYMGDKYGHSLATNLAVPLIYPKIKKKFGDVVTYEEDHTSHSRVELSFDVLQTARGNYASSAYHDFVGFNVSQPLLERAFKKTYGEDLKEVFTDLPLAVSTFRWSVDNLLPGLTRAAWALRRADIQKLNPTATSKSFHYKMSRKNYEQQYGAKRIKPGIGASISSFIIRFLPKVGPLKALKFKDPGPKSDSLFIKSFDTVLVHYAAELETLRTHRLTLPDIDFDTGKKTAQGEYGLADETYSELVLKLKDKKFEYLTPSLKNNILNYFSANKSTKFKEKNPDKWRKTEDALNELKTAKAHESTK
jgi:hypothetical protein